MQYFCFLNRTLVLKYFSLKVFDKKYQKLRLIENIMAFGSMDIIAGKLKEITRP